MVDDPKAARAAVEADTRRMARELKKLDAETKQIVSFEASDRSTWPPGSGDGMFIPITIGVRGKLSKIAAHNCAVMWQEVTTRYPEAIFAIHLLGYDDDPRKVWEFPEVCRYVRRWAWLAGLNDPETADFWVGTGNGRLPTPLSPDTTPYSTAGGVGFLAACGVFGEALRQIALRQHKPTPAN